MWYRSYYRIQSFLSIDNTDNGCLTKGTHFSFLLPLSNFYIPEHLFFKRHVLNQQMLNVDTHMWKGAIEVNVQSFHRRCLNIIFVYRALDMNQWHSGRRQMRHRNGQKLIWTFACMTSVYNILMLRTIHSVTLRPLTHGLQSIPGMTRFWSPA